MNYYMEQVNKIAFLDITRYQRYDPRKLNGIISREPGLYIWWNRNSDKPVYIGVALNKRGLLGRVVRQHLCTTYLELRPEKIAKELIVTDYKGRKATEKSVFRKKVCMKYTLLPGSDCVEFIKNNFLVSLVPITDVQSMTIAELERLLIEAYRPEFNTQFVKEFNVVANKHCG